MAENRKSFLIHTDSLSILDEMTDEQAGQLLKAIYTFQKGEDPVVDFAIKMAFIPFKNQFLRDQEVYKKVVERNRTNGQKGGRPAEPKETQKTQSVISEPKKAVNDNDNDNESDNKKDNGLKGESGENATTHTPEFLAFQKWVGENCPSVLKMKEPITQDQFKKLTGDFSGKQIAETLKAMHNKMDLVKKYKSANLTLRNWIKIENKKSTQYGTKESTRISNREQSAIIDARIMEKLTGNAMDPNQEGPGIIPMQE